MLLLWDDVLPSVPDEEQADSAPRLAAAMGDPAEPSPQR